MKKQFIVFACIFFCLCSMLWAEETKIGADGSRSKETPTKITSDKMVYQSKVNRVIFEGNVYVWRQDFELWSDKLFVFFMGQRAGDRGHGTEDRKQVTEGKDQAQLQPGAGDIDKIVAEGHVRFLREGKRGECDRIIFDPETKVIRMEGSPRVMEGRNKICGKIIILNLKKNTSEVIGNSKQRVQAIFFTSPGLQEDGKIGR